MAIRVVNVTPLSIPDGAAPVLVPVDRIRVPFHGDRGGVGPRTLGSTNMVRWIVGMRPYLRMLDGVLDLPDGATLDDVTATLAVLIARHESLRTTLPEDESIQRVVREGELEVGVYRVDGPAYPDADLAAELIQRLRATEFDLAVDLPIRVAVALDSDEVPRTAVVVYSHAVLDLESMRLLHLQFAEMVADPARREVRRPAHQPLEQALAERSPDGRRRIHRVTQHWERELRHAPQCPFPVPPRRDDAPRTPEVGWLWSPATALALPRITARTGATASTAVLAAVCAVLAARTGVPDIVLPMLTSNRTEHRLRDYVGPLAADTMIAVDASAGGFDEVIRRTGTAVLRARALGVQDTDETSRMIAEINHARGIHHARYCTFNDVGAVSLVDGGPGPVLVDPGDPRRALSISAMRWDPCPDPMELLEFQLLSGDGEFVLGAATRDSRLVTRTEIESLLHGVEALLVAAADGDVELARLDTLTGITPMPRGPQWHLVDSCWIQLPEVQRLVDDALPGVCAGVFAVPGPAGDVRLVAYLAGDPPPTPGQAHAACVAALPGRYTAMAPQWYVVCDGAPADPTDLTAWLERTVRCEGDGR